MSVGEMTDQDFPDRPNYDWLQAHEDNSLPAEYRSGARHECARRITLISLALPPHSTFPPGRG